MIAGNVLQQQQMSVPGDPEVNKFEQVSSDDHQMSQVRGSGQGVPWGPMSSGARLGWGRGPCTVSSIASWVVVTWDPDLQNDWLMDRHIYVMGGNKLAITRKITSQPFVQEQCLRVFPQHITSWMEKQSLWGQLSVVTKNTFEKSFYTEQTYL